MNQREFQKRLLRRYVNNIASMRELEALDYLLKGKEIDGDLLEVMDEVWKIETKELATKKSKVRKGNQQKWIWLAAAVSVMIFGVYFFFSPSHTAFEKMTKGLSENRSEISPGKNRAIVSLPNGQEITLSSAKSGIVVNSGAINYSDGSLIDFSALEDEGAVVAVASAPTTITTPRGGTYEVILEDGSKIQLNAETSIKFYPSFKRFAERRLELTGEAYFEVAKMKNKPFIVASKNQIIKVVGTHFNVSAYSDDAYGITTLVEGAIKINNKLLKPNQQAQQFNGNINIQTVDPRNALDWKNGEFICKSEALESIMKKISRWYDVEVVFESSSLRQKTFSGSLSRYANVNDLLEALAFTGIKSRVDQRTIYIIN
jgi:transmembrane sensor